MFSLLSFTAACYRLINFRLSNIGEMFSLGQGASTVCMRPIDALEGENEPHLAAIGNNHGVIHLVDVLNSIVYKELHVHGCPIKFVCSPVNSL